MTRAGYIPGLTLCGAFYNDVVRPLLTEVPHSVGLLGWGSDVLGFDTEQSCDHGFGPRLLVFIEDSGAADEATGMLSRQLPGWYQGWPVRFGWDEMPVQHHVAVTTLGDWLIKYLGVDATAGMSTRDWLLTPQQRLLGVTAGAVYSDETGSLQQLRTALAWYPDQVWRWLLACQWRRLAQEEAFVARTADVGDDAGSAVTTARLVRHVMRLAMLLDRRYAPYQKWLGTAFARGDRPDELPQQLAAALAATAITAREEALSAAYTSVARRHNAAGLTDPIDTATRLYHDRPAQVLLADRFADACLATVTAPALLALPLIGGIDQVVTSTDVLQHPAVCRRLTGL